MDFKKKRSIPQKNSWDVSKGEQIIDQQVAHSWIA